MVNVIHDILQNQFNKLTSIIKSNTKENTSKSLAVIRENWHVPLNPLKGGNILIVQ